VNETQLDIVHIHGDITPLQVPQGKPTHNLVKKREGLGFELRNAFTKLQGTDSNYQIRYSCKTNAPKLRSRQQQSLVAIEIIPLTDTVERHYLIDLRKL
jgi:two-component system CheB/CheR fusion protein